jgi:hypothetical protein
VISELWTACDISKDGQLDVAEYTRMFEVLWSVVKEEQVTDSNRAAVHVHALREFESDCAGAPHLDAAAFRQCVFQIADSHCGAGQRDAATYAAFLRRLHVPLVIAIRAPVAVMRASCAAAAAAAGAAHAAALALGMAQLELRSRGMPCDQDEVQLWLECRDKTARWLQRPPAEGARRYVPSGGWVDTRLPGGSRGGFGEERARARLCSALLCSAGRVCMQSATGGRALRCSHSHSRPVVGASTFA